MKITKTQLKQLIREEISKTLKENKEHNQAEVGDYLLVKTGEYPEDDYVEAYRTTMVAQIIEIATERNPEDY
jgi:hypothetical protein